MYTDDTSLYFKSRDLSRLNENLSRLDAWLTSNRLSLNVAKTQSMLVSTKARRKAFENPKEVLATILYGGPCQQFISESQILSHGFEETQIMSLRILRP